MKPILKMAVRVNDLDMIAIVLDDSIVKAAAIKHGEIFEQLVTKEGILLKRYEVENHDKKRHPAGANQQTLTQRQVFHNEEYHTR